MIMMPLDMPKSPAKDNKKSSKSLFPSSAGIVMNFHHSAVAKVRVMFFRNGERAIPMTSKNRKKGDLRGISPVSRVFKSHTRRQNLHNAI